MNIVNSLRDRGMVVRLSLVGAIQVVPASSLSPEDRAALTGNRDAVLATLHEEQSAISEMILACQQQADVYPAQAKQFGTALRQWQAGDLTDRHAVWLSALPLVDAILGRTPVSGEELAALLREVFPAKMAVVDQVKPKAAQPLNWDALAEPAPKQETMAI